jgi:hypothetical protein
MFLINRGIANGGVLAYHFRDFGFNCHHQMGGKIEEKNQK